MPLNKILLGRMFEALIFTGEMSFSGQFFFKIVEISGQIQITDQILVYKSTEKYPFDIETVRNQKRDLFQILVLNITAR